MAKRARPPADGIERQKRRALSRATKRGIRRAKQARLQDRKQYSRSKGKSMREIVEGLFGVAAADSPRNTGNSYNMCLSAAE